MNPAAIIALVAQGITLVEQLLAAGKDVAPAITAIKNLVSKPAASVTQADLDATETVLDSMLADFNTDLPASG